MLPSQKVKIISKQLPFRHLVVGAVLLLGEGADLWRLPIPATKPLTTNKMQTAQASSAGHVAGLTNLQVIGGIDGIDIT
jgi:hypothetical protein